jgi:hypothetical protein
MKPRRNSVITAPQGIRHRKRCETILGESDAFVTGSDGSLFPIETDSTSYYFYVEIC